MKTEYAPRRGFRVINRTKWRTMDLRRIVAEVVRRQGGPEHGFLVYVETGGYSGRAVLGGTWMVVRLPTVMSAGSLDHRQFATTIAHELAHLRGLRGERDMRSSKWLGSRKGTEHYAWADELPLRPVAPPAKPSSLEVAKGKRVQAAAQVQNWERKLRFAQNKVKAWRTKERYYEKRAAELTKAEAGRHLKTQEGS